MDAESLKNKKAEIELNEQIKDHYERHRLHWQACQSSRDQMEKWSVEIGLSAIRSCLLINGGASVALLAFLGTVMNPNNHIEYLAIYIKQGLALFISGVVASLISFLLAYIIQILYNSAFSGMQPATNQQQRSRKIGKILHVVEVIIVILSLAFFCLGVFRVTTAI